MQISKYNNNNSQFSSSLIQICTRTCTIGLSVLFFHDKHIIYYVRSRKPRIISFFSKNFFLGGGKGMNFETGGKRGKGDLPSFCACQASPSKLHKYVPRTARTGYSVVNCSNM